MRAALTARIAIGTAAGAVAAALLGAWVTGATVDGAAGTAVRTALVLVVLVLVPWWALRQELLQAHRARLRTWAVAGVLVGYLVNPFAWRGDALVAAAFTQRRRLGRRPGPVDGGRHGHLRRDQPRGGAHAAVPRLHRLTS